MTRLRNVGQNMMLVAVLTVFAKLFAIVRQIVLTYCFGATSLSDAYILAQTIPSVLFLLVSSAIGVSFIPVFNQVKASQGEEEAENFTSRMIHAVCLVASVLVLITLLFAPQIIFIFASGFDETAAALAAKYLRISIFSIYFIGMCGIFSAYLKIKGDYFFPSLTGVVISVVEIVACVVAYHSSDVILAIGITVAALAQFVMLFVSGIKHHYHHRLHTGFWNHSIRQALFMALPIMMGLGVDEINVIVDKTIASGFQTGSISVLNYANLIVSTVHNIISVSIYTVLFTEVSALAVQNNRPALAGKLSQSLQAALFLLIPATVGTILFAEPIIRVLYQRGTFTPQATVITAGAMVFYALYLVPNGLRIIAQSYFYAYGRTKFCMVVGFIAVAVNITFNITLSRSIGINGLALATSLGIAVAAIILMAKLLMENRSISVRMLLKKTVLILFNTGLMSLVAWRVFLWMQEHIFPALSLLVAVLVGVSIYFICSFCTHTLDPHWIKMFLRKRGVSSHAK